MKYFFIFLILISVSSVGAAQKITPFGNSPNNNDTTMDFLGYIESIVDDKNNTNNLQGIEDYVQFVQKILRTALNKFKQ
jgi:hypothetical protein